MDAASDNNFYLKLPLSVAIQLFMLPWPHGGDENVAAWITLALKPRRVRPAGYGCLYFHASERLLLQAGTTNALRYFGHVRAGIVSLIARFVNRGQTVKQNEMQYWIQGGGTRGPMSAKGKDGAPR